MPETIERLPFCLRLDDREMQEFRDLLGSIVDHGTAGIEDLAENILKQLPRPGARDAMSDAPPKFYSRPVSMPKTKRDGLANFVQIIINRLEDGELREALLQAVDLWNDITSGLYDSAMTDAKAHHTMVDELRRDFSAELTRVVVSARADGINTERQRIKAALGNLLGLAETA